MRTGKCPKCNSTEIRGPRIIEQFGYYSASNIVIRLKKRTAALRGYICANCGFTELYPDKKGLKNIHKAYKK